MATADTLTASARSTPRARCHSPVLKGEAAIVTGWVLTPLVQKQIEAKAKEDGISVEEAKENLLREKQPMLKFTTPEEIGGLVVFLCSEDAATMTGGTVQIDGGWTAQ